MWEKFKFDKLNDSAGLSRDPIVVMPTVKSPGLIGLENARIILLLPGNMIFGEIISCFLYFWR